MLFFRDCSTVIWGAPRNGGGAPRSVPGTTRYSQACHRCSKALPSDSIRRQQCPPTVWYSPEHDVSKFTFHIDSDTPGGFQWLNYILLMLAGRWVGGEERELPTQDDFSTNFGWNSVPVLPVFLMHCRRQLRVNLVISKSCTMSPWWKFTELYYCRVSSSIVTSKLYLLQQLLIQICQYLYQLTATKAYILWYHY